MMKGVSGFREHARDLRRWGIQEVDGSVFHDISEVWSKAGPTVLEKAWGAKPPR